MNFEGKVDQIFDARLSALNRKLGVGMKAKIDLWLCSCRLGLTEIVGRSLWPALDFEPDDGISMKALVVGNNLNLGLLLTTKLNRST